MASFFDPITIQIGTIPIIVYPCSGLETVFERTEDYCLEKHIEDIYKQNNELKKGEYHIIILWNDDKDKMSDVWIFDNVECLGSGPLVDVKICRNFERETRIGVSAGDGLILLGRETELEEKLRKSNKGVKDYIKSKRPALPDDIKPIEAFYTK